MEPKWEPHLDKLRNKSGKMHPKFNAKNRTWKPGMEEMETGTLEAVFINI
jgi:hypothetical protein